MVQSAMCSSDNMLYPSLVTVSDILIRHPDRYVDHHQAAEMIASTDLTSISPTRDYGQEKKKKITGGKFETKAFQEAN